MYLTLCPCKFFVILNLLLLPTEHNLKFRKQREIVDQRKELMLHNIMFTVPDVVGYLELLRLAPADEQLDVPEPVPDVALEAAVPLHVHERLLRHHRTLLREQLLNHLQPHRKELEPFNIT